MIYQSGILTNTLKSSCSYVQLIQRKRQDSVVELCDRLEARADEFPPDRIPRVSLLKRLLGWLTIDDGRDTFKQG
jgi:hypothetical protein